MRWELKSTGHIPGVIGSGMGALVSGAFLWWELGDKVSGTLGWLTGEFCGKFLGGVATGTLHYRKVANSEPISTETTAQQNPDKFCTWSSNWQWDRSLLNWCLPQRTWWYGRYMSLNSQRWRSCTIWWQYSWSTWRQGWYKPLDSSGNWGRCKGW